VDKLKSRDTKAKNQTLSKSGRGERGPKGTKGKMGKKGPSPSKKGGRERFG